ncbi:hypothetical protein SDC9_206140 [bioreactor metagenome]|uniref:Uncharacterized protein n=1 Tax=bioreactor metagenome TaxID=1076179 RepID=A0A645J3Z5_9ZZZZ
MGTASIKVTPKPKGRPFFINLLAIGIMAHSHTGKMNPISEAPRNPKNLFLGIIFVIVSSDTNT